MHSSFGSQFLFYNPTTGVNISSHWFVGGWRKATGRVGTQKSFNQLFFSLGSAEVALSLSVSRASTQMASRIGQGE